MLVNFSSALARLRFQHQITPLPNGGLAYRLANGSGHVAVSRHEWDEAGDLFKASTGRSLRRARIASLLWLPGFVLYNIICGAIIPREVVRVLPWSVYNTLFLGPFFATPGIIYLWHSYEVKRICTMIDAFFVDRPRIASPAALPWHPPFWFDLLCLLFVGPYLIIAVTGQIDPGLFRNTPLSGRHMDGVAAFGMVLLAARLAWLIKAKRTNGPAAGVYRPRPKFTPL